MAQLIVVILSCLVSAHAKREYVAKLPHGADTGVAAVGHTNPAGGGAANQFGKAFSAGGLVWNAAICNLDSDGDGRTNGEELGDPCCRWTEASGTPPERSDFLTNPGDAHAVTTRGKTPP